MFLQLFSSAIISLFPSSKLDRDHLDTQGMHKSLPLKVKAAFEIAPYMYKTYSVFFIVMEIKIYLFSAVDLIYCFKI